jgi:hypothetical protein
MTQEKTVNTIADEAIAAGLTSKVLDKAEVKELVKQSDQLVAHYHGFKVTSEVQYVEAANDLAIIKGQINKVEEERFAITRPMDAAKKAVMDFFRPFQDRLEDAERIVKKGMSDWHQEQERIRAAEQRKAREAAEKEAKRLREIAEEADRKAAAKERDRLAKLQAEADERAAIEAKKLAEQRAQAKSEEDKRRAQEQEDAAEARRQREQEELHQQRLASEAEQRERTARAETLEAQALATTSAPLAPAVAKIKGVSAKKVWKFEIIDPLKVPREYLIVDESKVRAVVKALGANANIPGVRAYQEAQIASRSK